MAQGSSPAAAAPALGKHEELATQGLACTCRPEKLRLLSNHGELVQPRGKCVNQCHYCAKLAAIENGEMLILDAMNGDAPTLLAITGTRTATLDMSDFREGKQAMVRTVRRRWPDAQYACEVEFTTGYGPRSGGKRRPHWNWLWKGIPVGDVAELRKIVREVWCLHVDAEPARQYVEPIGNPVAALKYITAHYMKASQRPPDGFTGQRFNCSTKYFAGITRTVARARARDSLALKRELWKADQAGHQAHDAELVAHEAMAIAARTRWVLTNDIGARLGKQPLPEHELQWRMFLQLRENAGRWPAPTTTRETT